MLTAKQLREQIPDEQFHAYIRRYDNSYSIVEQAQATGRTTKEVTASYDNSFNKPVKNYPIVPDFVNMYRNNVEPKDASTRCDAKGKVITTTFSNHEFYSKATKKSVAENKFYANTLSGEVLRYVNDHPGCTTDEVSKMHEQSDIFVGQAYIRKVIKRLILRGLLFGVQSTKSGSRGGRPPLMLYLT